MSPLQILRTSLSRGRKILTKDDPSCVNDRDGHVVVKESLDLNGQVAALSLFLAENGVLGSELQLQLSLQLQHWDVVIGQIYNTHAWEH